MSDAHVHAHSACIKHSALKEDDHKGGTVMHVEARGCGICAEITEFAGRDKRNYTSVAVVIL